MTDRDLPANASRRDLDRWFAVELNNQTWDLIDNGLSDESPLADQDRALYGAYAAAYHWLQAGTVANHGRAEYLIATVAAVTGRLPTAREHAARLQQLIAGHQAAFADWDRASAAEVVARVAARSADPDAGDLRAAAQRLADQVAGPEERQICRERLAAPPWSPA